MNGFTMRKRASAMALGIALATGAVITTGTIGFADPAHAQKKNKRNSKSPYSAEFIAVYNPLNEAVSEEGADISALKPKLNELARLSVNSDEKVAGGGLIYNAASRLNDQAMQLTGMELILESGKLDPEKVGQYTYIAYQLSNNTENFAKARTYLQRVIDIGYVPQGVTSAQLNILIAESYFGEERFQEGLKALENAIAEQKSKGQPVEERWYRRGLSLAYNNDIKPDVYDFTIGWVGDFPSTKNWRDAINVARNLNEFESPEMLDLMRLGSRLGTLSDKQDVIVYVESADPRRSPLEVKNLIEKAYADGMASRDDIYLADSLDTASNRLSDDRGSLPGLAAEADQTTTDTKIVMAAGDAFFSYGEYDKAERFFAKALNMPNVETQVALTRLGMAQIELGKFDAAMATLSKVQGVRMPIAGLWMAYAQDLADGTAQTAAAGG